VAIDGVGVGAPAKNSSLAKDPVAEDAVLIQIETRSQIKSQLSGKDQTFQLKVDLGLPAGITILFGPSGAGKTTLLDCVAGLKTPNVGRIVVENRVLFDSARETNVSAEARRVGYVFQDLALFPHLTAAQNIQYGLHHLSIAERKTRTNAILQSFRIAHLHDRRPAEISGGERQRVALARALVTDPCVLLLDEPLSALDAPTKASIVDDLRAWHEAHRIPILYVTHNREEVFALGERVVVLEQGRITAQGTPHQVMTAPRQETIAQLAGFENIFDAKVVAAHDDRGTMTCRIETSDVELETPLVRANVGSKLKIGIRAGDILLATIKPAGLSARNVIRGKLKSLAQRDMIVVAKVRCETELNCGVDIMVHLTLAARDNLHLESEREVWIIIKTYSCHLMV
jgi:molybdate transport system ATP-binding protein